MVLFALEQYIAKGGLMLPIDLILVRHGQSEGNVANKASERGDNSFFTPEFRQRHSRSFRLTDNGITQAMTAGEWLRKNVIMPLDRFYVSDYVRAKETAAYLVLPAAEWRSEFLLRERDKALMDNCPFDEQQKLYEFEQRQYAIDPFLSYPAGGGESIAMLCLRMRDFLNHLARECPDKRIIVVCHGHVMRALQLELGNLGHDDFIRLDASEDMPDRIRNCQILWYTRRDPDTGKIREPRIVAVRSICPWDPKGDYGWRKIERRRYSNDELMEEVSRYPRHISG
ncbi:MAG: phosphoglycerate mutase family protein [bacterium]|nr:phosphoglycerate mutase family protein [bacterium]